MMSNELVKSDFYSQLAELDKIQDTCKKLLNTKHYQNLGEAGIHAIIARSKALGIHPFEALNGGFFVINGKVGMSTEMMAALVRQRGHSIQQDPKSNDQCIILNGKRGDNGDTWTCSFSKADAESAGLWTSATWKKYPKIMLYNRCMSMLFRQLFPDISLGAGYVEDELKEITKTCEYNPIIDISPSIENVKPLYIEEKKQEDQKAIDPVISIQQVVALSALLNQCDPAFKCRIKDWMTEVYKSPLIEDLPARKYDEVMERCLANRERYQQEILEQEQEAVAQ